MNDDPLAALPALRESHRALDEALAGLHRDRSQDEVTMWRLKRRKLALKDMISRLESAAIPDGVA